MKIIGIKQLHKNLKQVSDATAVGQSFLVVKNSKPVFRINPIEEVEEKKYKLEDFKKLQFNSDKNLSREVDKVVYG
ncbi:MAG TPA: hypothetical protein ENI66_00970 [Candidatus Yonathbacteria bacterium]|nr:hypothetical protein [Candidatus Yonathbacteria bacterium]